MFDVKSNEEIGKYLRVQIKEKYPSQRQFCYAYLKIKDSYLSEDEIKDKLVKMSNKLSQILKGTKGLQLDDLPVFCRLLEVSCEDILSAGETKLPILNRRTNYNIAYSKKKEDWIEYLEHEESYAAYLDEFGKSVVDYALDFENFELLRFLMDEGYIDFASNQYGKYSFGASTKIKDPNPHRRTFEDELLSSDILRKKVISFAIRKDDIEVLERLRAKHIPTEYNLVYYQLDLKLDENFDEKLIDAICSSNDTIFNYFCDKYNIESYSGEVTWLYPYLDYVAKKLVDVDNERLALLLDILINNNKEVFSNIKSSALSVAKQMRATLYNNRSYEDLLSMTLKNIIISDDKKILSFHMMHPYYVNMIHNIFYMDATSKDPKIQKKIEELNDSHNKIINIKDYLIKK